MTEVDLDERTAGQLKPGDEVLIRGVVVEAMDGVGVSVELFSKTDQYVGWIRLDQLARLILADVPEEPGDGTWLTATDYDVVVNVFHRDDARAPVDAERRWRRRWLVVGTGEWIDWPTVVHRGGDPDRQLYLNNGTK